MPYLDLHEWRKVLVTGTDALPWLDDLVSAGLANADGPRRSMLLTPTGRIRADFHVVPDTAGGVLLIQDPVQPRAIDDLLHPYVLSSDVRLSPFETPPYATWEAEVITPIGWTRREPPRGLSLEAFDGWRLREAIPRFGVDLDEDSLPQEAGWERFIDFTKGCFMGQEAMAKIRNFGGHPNRVIRAVRADAPVEPGDRVRANGEEAGVVTSAAGTDAIARVTWRAQHESLVTVAGVALTDR
jgi:folate-binding protein YgfZ